MPAASSEGVCLVDWAPHHGALASCTHVANPCSYSLLFLMTDKNHLLNSFPFMVKYVALFLLSACLPTPACIDAPITNSPRSASVCSQFRHVVEYLKSACQRTYDLDVKTRRPGPSGPQGAGLGMSHGISPLASRQSPPPPSPPLNPPLPNPEHHPPLALQRCFGGGGAQHSYGH